MIKQKKKLNFFSNLNMQMVMFRSKIQHPCLQSPLGVFAWQVHIMSRFKTLLLEKFFTFWKLLDFCEVGMLGKPLPGKHYALYTPSLIKVPESEEVGVGLVGTGRERRGVVLLFSKQRGGLMALCNIALLLL